MEQEDVRSHVHLLHLDRLKHKPGVIACIVITLQLVDYLSSHLFTSTQGGEIECIIVVVNQAEF